MADKRMFSKAIIDSDVFLDMPLSAQALYFHFSMRADDEGFVGNPKRIQRLIGASDDDVKILLAKRYILAFDSGIVVIKHWYINNYIQNDRFHPTTYIEEKNSLLLDDKKAYTEKEKLGLDTSCIQNGYSLDTQNRLDKNRLDKNRLERENTHAHELDFLSNIPTLQEVQEYITLKDFNVDPERFFNYYSAKGWKLGNTPIDNWQILVNEWERKEAINERMKNEFAPQPTVIKPKVIEAQFEQRKYTDDDFAHIFNGSNDANNITDDDI